MIEGKNEGVFLQDLSVGYGTKSLIDEINLHVAPGEILTLIGPNGAGKSTILKTITGQLKNMGGVVFLSGMRLDALKEEEIAKSLAMVMTERLHTELMTCFDVVATGRYPYTGRLGILSKEDKKIVRSAIELVGAEPLTDLDFTKISDGERQRVMLARAIAQEPDILVLDEPTSYLDMRYKLSILSCVRKLANERKIAVILSLHELDLALQLSDTIACVAGNKIGKVGNPEEVFRGDYIQKLYGVEIESFDSLTGQLYFPKEEAEPEIFVIAGGGCGIPIYNKLWRKRIPFAAGILMQNDVEYQAALAKAGRVISSKAFSPASQDQIEEARKLIDACDKCICPITSFGAYNVENEGLMKYALEKGKLISNGDFEI